MLSAADRPDANVCLYVVMSITAQVAYNDVTYHFAGDIHLPEVPPYVQVPDTKIAASKQMHFQSAARQVCKVNNLEYLLSVLPGRELTPARNPEVSDE